MKENLNEKLTFLLLIKERRNFTLRFINFITSRNFEFKLFIADGSKKKIPKYFLDKLDDANIEYQYKKFPLDKDYKRFQLKIWKSLQYIKTKYVLLFSDDDFPIIKTINSKLNFLEKNKKFVACGGYTINFDLFNNMTNFNEYYDHPINFVKMMVARSNDNINELSRIYKYLNIMESSWHYVFRKEILLKNYHYVQKSNVNFHNVDFYDYFQDSVNFISGKIKKINKLAFLHQYHTQNIINDRLNYEMLLRNKKYKKDTLKLFTLINKRLSNKNKISEKKFFKSKLFSSQSKNNFQKSQNFFKNLRSIKLISLTYNFLLNFKMKFSNKHIIRLLSGIQDTKTRNELNFIFNFLTKKI